MLSDEWFDGDSVNISYARGPANRRSLVMFHGVTRRWQSFLTLIPSLITRWQVLAWDARGHGFSDRADSYRVVDYVDDAVSFVRKAGGQRSVLYGHSLGAMVALATAAAAPELIAGVVLEDPPFHTMGRRIHETPLHSFFQGLQPFAGDLRNPGYLAKDLAEIRITAPNGGTTRLGDVRDATSLRFTAQSLSQLDPAVLTPIVAGEWLEGYDLPTILSNTVCPVLLLQADQACGGMLTDADAELLATQLPDCTRVRFPNAPHLIHWTQTENLLRHVIGFLETV